MTALKEQLRSESLPLVLAAISDDALWEELSGPLGRHFRVWRESDGLRAIDVCQLLRPAGLIAETELPRLSGILLTRLITANRYINKLPIALIMSRDYLIEEFWASDSGAVATVPRNTASDAIDRLSDAIKYGNLIPDADWAKAEMQIKSEGGPAAGVASELEKQLIGASIIAKLADIESTQGPLDNQTLGIIPSFIHKALSALSTVLEFAQAGVTLIRENRMYMVENRFFSHLVQPGAFVRETEASSALYFDNRGWITCPEVVDLPPIHRELRGPRGQASTFFALPISGREGVYGLLSLMTYKDIATREYYLHTLSLIGSQLAVTLERALFYEELRRLSVTDALTGLSNRRAIFQRLDEEFRRSVRYQVPFSVAVCDIDNFKLLNDKYGHQAGDEVLKQVAAILRQSVREVDLAGRWGGEEMALLFPLTDLNGALTACERIRNQVASHVVDFANHKLSVTLSIGVAAIDPEKFCPISSDALVGLADGAMYYSKELGKNQVSSFLQIIEAKSPKPFKIY